MLSRGGLKGTDGQTTLAATTLSGGSISLQATGQPGLNPDGGVNLNSNPNAPSGIQLAGVKLSTPAQLRLDAGEGKLAFNLIQTTQSTSQESRQRDLTYQKAKGQGATSTQAEYNELSYGALVLSSPTVVVQHAQSAGTAGALTPASLSELSAKPGMGWLNDVQRQQAALAQTAQTNPAAALHIERVQLAHEQWDYKSQGLTQEGAVIVAVVVAYFTAGAGSSLVSAAAGTAGGGAAGATAGAAAGAGLGTTVAIGAAQAGITTLATQASISLINNQGNIGKTLDELGSSASVKTLLTAIITGGVLGGMNFSPTGQPTAGGGAQSFTSQLGQNLQAGIARSLISTAINGGSLEDSLKTNLLTAFIDTGAAQGAFAIGEMKQAGTLDAFTHKLAHALAGCAAGAARAGGDGCAPGAIGAALGEISAEAYGRKSDTVEFAAMISGIGAALAGGDASQISLASAAGANAAANNYLKHTEALRLAALNDKKRAGQCDSVCHQEIAELKVLDDQRNQKLQSCSTLSSASCDAARQEVRSAAAEYVRRNIATTDLLYRNEQGETVQLASDTLTGVNAGAALGYLTTLKEGIVSLASVARTGFDALILQDPQAQQQAKEGAGTAWTFVADPANWPELMGAMSAPDREKLAKAYETGDGKAVGQLLGAQIANLPIGGGGMGTIKKIDTLLDAVTSAKLVALKADGLAANTVNVGSKGSWEKPINGANGGTAVVDGLAFRADLPSHMIGPDGFTKSGQLSGTHNLANATSALDTKGATYTLNPTGTTGVYELPYTYTNPATGKVVSGSKTVYDPAVFSDQTMINNAQQAGQQAWTQYLQNPTVKVIDGSVGGVNFRSYINVDKNGNAFIGNVHPIK